MPTYELSMMMRQMTRPELVSTLKRTAEQIFEKGGFIRKIDNLGFRNLPYKISEHGVVNRTGHAFVFKFDSPPPALADLKEEIGRDVDVIKRRIYLAEELEKFDCTLDEELQPPAYRKEVLRMIKMAKKGQKEKYPHNSELTYYPFQK